MKYTDFTLTMHGPADRLLLQELYLALCKEFQSAKIEYLDNNIFAGDCSQLKTVDEIRGVGIVLAQRCVDKAEFDIQAIINDDENKSHTRVKIVFNGEKLDTMIEE